MPMNDDEKSESEVQITWRKWTDKPEGFGHGVKLYASTVSKQRFETEGPVAFVHGFGWLHGGPQAVVYYAEPNNLTDREFNEMKLRVESYIRERTWFEGKITQRVSAIANC